MRLRLGALTVTAGLTLFAPSQVAAAPNAEPTQASDTIAFQAVPASADAEMLPQLERYELTAPSFVGSGFKQKAAGSSDMRLSLATGEPPASMPTAATGSGESQAIDLGLEPIDYNLPDPNRGAGNHFRALGGVTFANYVSWQFAWLFMDMVFVTRESIARNLRLGFIWDDNSLQTNFFRHPYQGSMYYHAARGAGLSFLESSLYTAFGSLQWEFIGETHPASPNDFYTTTLGGIALGEVFYRLSSEVLDDSSSGGERFWREIAAGALAPMRGFQRLTSGEAWAHGPPHQSPSTLDLELDFGIEHLRGSDLENPDGYDPAFLFGLQLEYGDQLPHNDSGTFEAYDFFDTYFSGTLLNAELKGGRMFIQGVLHGWNQWLSDPEETHPDNNIVGFFQSFEYANANLFELGGTGLGVSNWTNWRFGDQRDFRLMGGVEWQAMSGASSPFTAETGRTYNFGMGMSGTLRARLRLAPYGELTLYGKQYVVTVVDGEDGGELYGLVRATYELPFYRGLGVGVAPMWAYRYGSYTEQDTIKGDTFELQAYLLWRL